MSGDNVVVHQFPRARGVSATLVSSALESAVKRVAPLWPLDHFVAVNPFLGFAEERFEHASRRVRLACDGRMLMAREFYAEALADGRLSDADLLAVVKRGDAEFELADLHRHINSDSVASPDPLPTCATVCADITGQDWPMLVQERISHWAAGYFDAGQASWPSPFAQLSPFVAWKEEMRIDCSDTVLGLRQSQELLSQFPDDAREMCFYALQRLAVPDDALDLYLHRLLMTVGGWVAYTRYLGWQSELAGESLRHVLDLLAICLAWELMLVREYAGDGAELAWRREISAATAEAGLDTPMTREERLDLLVHEAFELAWQRGAITALRDGDAGGATKERPLAQAVFCIDVRSEVLRRAIEAVDESIETFGFAGFFGLPVEYVPLAGQGGAAHCPVLLEPAIAVSESVRSQPAEIVSRLSRRVRLRRQLARGWRAFRNSAVSCFVFVESYGLAYALKLGLHTLGLSRPEPHPRHRGLPPRLARNLGPQLKSLDGDAEIGIDRQIEFAESMLRGMSLTDGFARLVLLAGHGSTSTNNAHASGLDCGACGGQTGEASARLGALILNNPEVRVALQKRGIHVPNDTVFVAALHNTTTDEVALFDTEELPSTHEADLAQLRKALAAAGERSRGERSQFLALAPRVSPRDGVFRRSRDWSEVRPEWGLAGCAGFIAGPRELTRRLDLGGRCFLHSYDHRQDRDYRTLELIMTAPLVVASWISLQYYASTVCNERFGSGNKTLHNVVGGSLGVFEGNGGDLRVGLPLQSVHDGHRFVHEPRRLSVFLAAPIAAINSILERHEHVRHLADNGWLHLFAVYEKDGVVARYTGGLNWDATTGHTTENDSAGAHA